MPGAPRTTPSATRGAQADLAAHLQQTATGLEDRLKRRDTLIELIHSINGTLDPSEMGAMRCSVRRPNGFLPTVWCREYRTARRSRSSSAATVVGFPLIGLEWTIAALIALDSSPSTEFSAL